MNLRKMFETTLEVVKEENPLLPFSEQVAMARKWTCENAVHIIHKIAYQRLADHEEAVNKAFYG